MLLGTTLINETISLLVILGSNSLFGIFAGL